MCVCVCVCDNRYAPFPGVEHSREELPAITHT